MSTFSEIAHMIQDKLKLSSDDSYFTIEHIFFLMKNYRVVLLKQKYMDAKQDIPLINFQTICVPLELTTDCIRGQKVKSVNKIPDFANINGTDFITLNPIGDLFNNLEMTMVSDSRFPYVGRNK